MGKKVDTSLVPSCWNLLPTNGLTTVHKALAQRREAFVCPRTLVSFFVRGGHGSATSPTISLLSIILYWLSCGVLRGSNGWIHTT